VPGAGPHALLTRAPLSKGPKPQGPFDLHVLGAPPAFVLSQDQTLSLSPRPPKVAPRRTGIPDSRHHFAKVAPKPRPAKGSFDPGPTRPRGLLKGDKSEPRHPSPADLGRPQRHPKAAGAKAPPTRPATCQRCLSPTTPSRPPPTHPFPILPPCQRTRRRLRLRLAALLCRQTTPYSHKAGRQQALFAGFLDINLSNEIFRSTLSIY
jgi:hypothetical protein